MSWYARNGGNATDVWRVDADGSHPKQLTHGIDDELPGCSPDGKWLYYADNTKNYEIYREPIEGGTPELIKASRMKNGFVGGAGDLSPDGRLLAAIVTQIDPATQADIHALALIDVAANTESSIRIFPSQPTITFPVSFAPDGKSVAYRVIDKGTDNIWMQPVDGSTGHPVTEFTTDHIRGFSWSPDGKTLAVVRAIWFPMSYCCAKARQRSSQTESFPNDRDENESGEPSNWLAALFCVPSMFNSLEVQVLFTT